MGETTCTTSDVVVTGSSIDNDGLRLDCRRCGWNTALVELPWWRPGFVPTVHAVNVAALDHVRDQARAARQ